MATAPINGGQHRPIPVQIYSWEQYAMWLVKEVERHETEISSIKKNINMMLVGLLGIFITALVGLVFSLKGK